MLNKEGTPRQSSVIKNASFLFIAHLAGRILSFIITIILPRYFEGGFDDLGKLFFALWLTNLLSVITELGIHTPLIREVAADRSKATIMISNALVIRLILSAITLIIMIILSIFVYSGVLSVLILVIGLSEIINSIAQLFRCIFRSFENMEFEALGVILERGIVFLAGLALTLLGYGVIIFSIVILFASVSNLFVTTIIMWLRFSKINLKLIKLNLCLSLFKQSLPYALSGIIYMAYFRIDGIMLKNMMGASGDLAMGWYGTGYSFVNALTIIPGAFMGAVFPMMSRAFTSSGKEIESIYTRSMKLMLIIAIPMALFTTFLADNIVKLLYSSSRFRIQDYQAIEIIMKILIWSGALLFFNNVIITIFRAADKRKAFVVLTTLSLLVNVISNLILIPRYSYVGTSISMVISEMIFFIFGTFYVKKYISRISNFKVIIKSLFASFFLFICLLFWKYVNFINENVSPILIACISIVIYFLLLLAFDVIKKDDIFIS